MAESGSQAPQSALAWKLLLALVAPCDSLLSCWVGAPLPQTNQASTRAIPPTHGQRPPVSTHCGARISPITSSERYPVFLILAPLLPTPHCSEANQLERFGNCSTNSYTSHAPLLPSHTHTYTCTHPCPSQRTHSRNPAEGDLCQLTGPGQGWGSLREEGAPFSFAQRLCLYSL